MKRRLIQINEALCNGCGACVTACHEGAIALVDGKARLTREDVCDGLGDCLPACPTNAITLIEVETETVSPEPRVGGCPGSQATRLPRRATVSGGRAGAASQLAQWPCQIKLVPPNAPYFENADLLIAADCAAYACGSFHEEYMKGRITLIGCPKLDSVDYTERLAAILKSNSIRSVTVARMEVPCCRGLELAVSRALAASGKSIPCEVVVITTNGKRANGPA